MSGNGVPMYGMAIFMALPQMGVPGSMVQIDNLVAPCEAVHGTSMHFAFVHRIAATTIETLRRADSD